MTKAFHKTIFSTLVIFQLIAGCEKEVTVINLNAPYFTIVDSAFYYALIAQGVDKDHDLRISYEEAEAVKVLYVGGNTSNGRYCNDSTEIADYSGLEAFVNLEYFHCLCGDAVSLDLSGNTHLKFLDCSLNKLTDLDVSNCAELRELWCTTNYLNNLDVSHNQALEILGCVNNGISDLDVSSNTALVELNCGLNQLSSLDLSKLTSLVHLYCVENYLTSLDLSYNLDLLYLNFRDNELTSLDISGNTSLEYINGNRNNLSSLDLSNNSMLTTLFLKEMPSLQDVCIWELPFPPEGVVVETAGSPDINFTLCSR